MNRPLHFGYSEQYQSKQSALERQTALLLAERKQLQQGYSIAPDFRQPNNPNYHQSAAITPIDMTKTQSQSKTQEVVNKLQQIIALCKEEGLSNDEMKEVVKVENEVLNYLQRTAAHMDGPQPRPPSPHLSAPYNPSHLSHPLNPSQLSQASQTATKTKTKTEANKPGNAQGNFTWGKQMKPILSEDTVQIIGHIERRALSEIINLQQERDNLRRQKQIFAAELQRLKIQFTKINSGQPIYRQQRQDHKFSRIDTGQMLRLRQQNQELRQKLAEIQRLRQENRLLKEDNQYLSSRLEVLNSVNTQLGRQTQTADVRSTYPENFPTKPNLIYGQYDSQIAVYQNQLKRATVVINQLRSRLANVPGLEELHDQGQRIRRETTQLLQFKSSAFQGRQAAIIRDLQERLEFEERGKAAFLQELRIFKQKYAELQQENRALRKSKVSFDTMPKPQGSSPPRDGGSSRGIIKKKGPQLGGYQQTLNQMRQILR